MPTDVPITNHLGPAGTDFPADVAGVSTDRRATPAGSPPLLLRMSYAAPQVAVLSVAGDLDLATTPQLERLLWPRLNSTVSALVLDLGEVTFLGLTGLELLANAHTYAAHRGIPLCAVNRNHAVDRALAAGGLTTVLPCFGTVTDALTHMRGDDTTGREHTPRPVPAPR
ncbi:anti-anti-sigma factor [Halopolyspora algeriensis]|uniref:Anti-anti-sigma factor n=1 Tax=Halopolyspora algeriensis TaxID=1500506 RepID=A0A368VYB2_9ACTN|nr:STAS domain-containing protein [Halopolyspora algeriensis]RCW45822.1 anti-anti-sigma factor [Halopolyspora algeriensis]